MGWLQGFLKKTQGDQTEDFVFIDTLELPVEKELETIDRIEADQCYVNLFVDSLRIEKSRAFSTTFHGVAYSFVTMARQGSETSMMAALTKPANLSNLDSGSVGKVITVSQMMMGAVPWRGGTLSLELGLFSVKSGNLLSPVVDFVTRASGLAGIAFVGAVKPFLPLIIEGMDLIAGQTMDTRLVVGVAASMQLRKPVTCAIIAAKRNSIDISKLSLDPVDRKLLLDGDPLQAAYCVFSIRATDRKPEFGEIPELKAAFAALRAQIIAGDRDRALEALAVFRRTAIVSPDLIPHDAQRLIMLAQKQVADGFAVRTLQFGGAGPDRERRTAPTSLAELPLYAN